MLLEKDLAVPAPPFRLSSLMFRYLPALLTLVAVATLVPACRPVGSPEQQAAMKSLPELKRQADAPDADPLAHVAYGEKLARENQSAGAVQEFQRAARMLEPGKADPMAGLVCARLAYALAYAGEIEMGSAYLDRARRFNGDPWLLCLAEATLRIHRHDANEAIALSRRAVALRPESYESHYILGLCYNDNKDPGAAEVELKAAAALAPEFGAAQAELGHCYAYQSRYDKAAEQFRIARRIEPQNLDYLFALGEALGMGARNPDQYRAAVEVQQECLRATPSNGALLFTLGQLHLRFMNLEAAQKCLWRACELGAKPATTWYNLARVAELRGDTDTARTAYARFASEISLQNRRIIAEKRVVANPNDACARLVLARSFHAEGNLKGCYAQLKAALALNSALTDAQVELARLQAEFQRLLDQHGAAAAAREENNPTGPPGPDAIPDSVPEKTGGTRQ